jgi:carotenoid cleavage dioxygenase-like enzyme
MGKAAGIDLGFTSLDSEVTDRELPIEGDVPAWLRGSLFRNGPAKFDVGGDRVAHWFDGLAMVHRFSFADGGVSYTNRFLRSDAYREAVESGTISGQFATGDGGFLARLRQFLGGEPTDNCNVHVARVDEDLVAMTEVPRYLAVDPTTLGTRGEFHFADELGGHLNCAHVVPDPHRGETIGLLTRFGRTSCYDLYRLPDGSRSRELLASIPAKRPAYLHSFALTEGYVVLTEHPFVTSPRSFLLPGGESFVDHYEWEPARGTTFHVVDRDTGERVMRPTAEPSFVFHHVNAFEATEGGGPDEIVVDLVDYPEADVVAGLALADIATWFAEGDDGRLRRIRLPIDGGRPTIDRLHDGLELPRIAPMDRTKPYRYVYAQGAPDDGGNHLVKVDVRTGDARSWREAGLFVEEPVFVPAPERTPPNDDGVVLVTALNVDAERTELLVLDARNLSELGRAPLPHAVPFGFHGRFFPEW